MTQVKLNSEFIATEPGFITVYNYNGETREYISTSTEYLAVGVGIPAHSCLDAPGSNKAGYAICRSADFNSWEYVPDHRGEIIYSTETGESKEITALGDYPENTTTIAPLTPNDKWDGEKWVKDAEAEKLFRIREAEETKNSLMQVASEHIAPLQDAVDLEIATEEEASLLEAWKKYRVLLNRVDTSTAPDIEWPANPVRE
ncbi:tail fiber assembly protein [Shigella boydii]|nr:tail fiber assembly protein [Shigella boydii]